MKNLFVSYDIAKLLKDIQFDVSCIARYTKDSEQNIFYLSASELSFDLVSSKLLYGKLLNYNAGFYDEEGTISAPLYQQVIDWFRDKHNIEILICDEGENELGVEYSYYLNSLNNHKTIKTEICEDNYYEALDKAIKETIKLKQQ